MVDSSFSWGSVLAPHDPTFSFTENGEEPNFLPTTASARKLRICLVVNEFPLIDLPFGIFIPAFKIHKF
jgi:hypothetical protein